MTWFVNSFHQIYQIVSKVYALLCSYLYLYLYYISCYFLSSDRALEALRNNCWFSDVKD